MELVQGGPVGGLDGHDVAVVVQARQRLPGELAETLGVARVIVGVRGAPAVVRVHRVLPRPQLDMLAILAELLQLAVVLGGTGVHPVHLEAGPLVQVLQLQAVARLLGGHGVAVRTRAAGLEVRLSGVGSAPASPPGLAIPRSLNRSNRW